MFNMVIWHQSEERKEGNVLFSDALNAFYLQLYGKVGSVSFNDSLNTFNMVIWHQSEERKEGNVLFSDALNAFYLRLYGKEGKEVFHLTTLSTHFTYGNLATHSTHFTYGYMGRNERKCFI